MPCAAAAGGGSTVDPGVCAAAAACRDCWKRLPAIPSRASTTSSSVASRTGRRTFPPRLRSAFEVSAEASGSVCPCSASATRRAAAAEAKGDARRRALRRPAAGAAAGGALERTPPPPPPRPCWTSPVEEPRRMLCCRGDDCAALKRPRANLGCESSSLLHLEQGLRGSCSHGCASEGGGRPSSGAAQAGALSRCTWHLGSRRSRRCAG